MQETYEEWEQYAKRITEDLEQQGKLVNKVVIDINEFLRWCERDGKPKDGGSRVEFAATKAQNSPQQGIPPDRLLRSDL